MPVEHVKRSAWHVSDSIALHSVARLCITVQCTIHSCETCDSNFFDSTIYSPPRPSFSGGISGFTVPTSTTLPALSSTSKCRQVASSNAKSGRPFSCAFSTPSELHYQPLFAVLTHSDSLSGLGLGMCSAEQSRIDRRTGPTRTRKPKPTRATRARSRGRRRWRWRWRLARR